MRKKKTGVISTIFLILILLVGLSVMLYPTISDWWNSKVQTRAIASYSQAVEELDDGEAELLLQQAKDYNKDLYNLPAPFTNCDQLSAYDSLLNISGTGIMGYITIPVIHVELPIYHGTSEEVLNIAAGHLKGSTCRSAEQIPILSFPPIVACPRRNCSPISTSWSWGIRSRLRFWIRF